MATIFHESTHCEYNPVQCYRQLHQECQNLRSHISEEKSKEELLENLDKVDEKAKEFLCHFKCFKKQENSVKAIVERMPTRMQNIAENKTADIAVSGAWIIIKGIVINILGSIAYVILTFLCAHPLIFGGIAAYLGLASVAGSIDNKYFNGRSTPEKKTQ